MGCPGGHLGKRRSILHPNKAQQFFFSHYNLFLGRLKEKLARKAPKYWASISDRAHALWAPNNTP